MSAGRLSDSLEVIEDSILVGEKYGHEDTHQVGPASMLPPLARHTSQTIVLQRDTSRPPGRLASAMVKHLHKHGSAIAWCCLQQQGYSCRSRWMCMLCWGQAHGTLAMMADTALRHSSSWQMSDTV